MSIQSTLRYIFILITSLALVVAAMPVYAQHAVADTVVVDTVEHKVKKVDSASHQLTIGVDLVRPIANAINTSMTGYEFAVDYYLKNEFYAVLEGGFGGSTVDYPDLKYKTTNDFVRLGFNKSLLSRDRPKDWDMMFMGMRLGAANVSRSDATYIVIDSLWGNSTGKPLASSNFLAIWAELTAGMRVELLKNFSAGWNVRGKFILNGKSFNELSPLYISGYGRGDKTSNFDFNVYLSYAFRWKRQHLDAPAKPPGTMLPVKQ
jgi:hypothetical protein